MKKLIIPGELLFPFEQKGEFFYCEEGKTYSCVVGIFDTDRKVLTPLESIYTPKPMDKVIGIVTEVRFVNYIIDINSPFEGVAFSKFIRFDLNVGDIVEATVKNIEGSVVVLQDIKRLVGGKLVEIKPSKIPRVIGKKGSMQKVIEEATKTKMVIGSNGRIWIKGENIAKATKAIKKIEKEAHSSGLTEKIINFLKE
ncbi:MAG: KH domain-containing protein [Candidatus Micrarchaeia archaeon]|jgi:exosome complex component RRP4